MLTDFEILLFIPKYKEQSICNAITSIGIFLRVVDIKMVTSWTIDS